MIAKRYKTLSDGEFFTETLLGISDVLFANFKNKKEIKAVCEGLQLSRRTVTRRIEILNTDVQNQLLNRIEECVGFSMQLDESTDITDTAQLLVFVRLVFDDFATAEELLCMISLKQHTRGVDIYNGLMVFIEKNELFLHELISITTDGAGAMTGAVKGIVALCRKNPNFPNFLSYHCIIHQQVLASKRLNTQHVIDVAFKIILFLDERGDDSSLLRDPKWRSDLASLTDITTSLALLNKFCKERIRRSLT